MSFGVVIWELLSEDTPHKGLNFSTLYNQIREKGQTLKMKGDWSEPLQELMRSCWIREAWQRIRMPKIHESLMEMIQAAQALESPV